MKLEPFALSPRVACALLGCTPKQLKVAIDIGMIRAIPFDRSYVIPTEEILRYAWHGLPALAPGAGESIDIREGAAE